LKDRLNALRAEPDRAKSTLERAKSAGGQPILIDPALLERFGRNMRDHFTSGSIPFRKAYLQSLIDVIEVDDDQIRIKGRRDVLERVVLAQDTPIPRVRRRVPSGAPFRIKLRTLILLKLLYNSNPPLQAYSARTR
jgi:hypothetical protein